MTAFPTAKYADNIFQITIYLKNTKYLYIQFKNTKTVRYKITQISICYHI